MVQTFPSGNGLKVQGRTLNLGVPWWRLGYRHQHGGYNKVFQNEDYASRFQSGVWTRSFLVKSWLKCSR